MQPFPSEPAETIYAITVDPAHEAAEHWFAQADEAPRSRARSRALARVRVRSVPLIADLFATAGIVMSQAIDGNGRVITLDMWGQAQLDIHLLSCSQDEPLDYVDTGIWTRTDRREFLRQLATPAFVERIVDRLMSWAGMSLERACKTAELALAEVDAAAVVRPSTSADSSWSVEVIRPAPTTGTIVSGRPAQDEPTFSSET